MSSEDPFTGLPSAEEGFPPEVVNEATELEWLRFYYENSIDVDGQGLANAFREQHGKDLPEPYCSHYPKS